MCVDYYCSIVRAELINSQVMVATTLRGSVVYVICACLRGDKYLGP